MRLNDFTLDELNQLLDWAMHRQQCFGDSGDPDLMKKIEIMIENYKENPCLKLRELSELSEEETFQVINLLENENDRCYMATWDRVEANYLFDENLNPIEI